MIITFVNPKGGSGKSTLLYNLAIRLSKERAVSVVDMDIQGSIAEYLRDRGRVAPLVLWQRPFQAPPGYGRSCRSGCIYKRSADN